jgi:uncharacterized damage-inducible protein DinB
MAISDSILSEFDQEMASTRKTLERVPLEKFNWKPHEKSMSMGGLATHLSNLPSWTSYTLEHESLDLAPGGAPLSTATIPDSAAALLQAFDNNVATARAAIARTTDQEFVKMWQLQRNGVTLLTLPKVAVLRGFVMNHNIHHRAQLGVYLRLNDIPVPSIYGPSADENPFQERRN